MCVTQQVEMPCVAATHPADRCLDLSDRRTLSRRGVTRAEAEEPTEPAPR